MWEFGLLGFRVLSFGFGVLGFWMWEFGVLGFAFLFWVEGFGFRGRFGCIGPRSSGSRA